MLRSESAIGNPQKGNLMRLLKYSVVGFLDRKDTIQGEFHDDINILTGRNGAGKTTLLKLIWYIISGNLLHALSEVSFAKATIVTDEYECTVFRTGNLTCKVEFLRGQERTLFEDEGDPQFDWEPYSSAEDAADPILRSIGSSVFFPTFRRIEGGFTIESSRSRPMAGRITKSRSDVEEALVALSRKLSNDPHVFVSAISTVDIVSLLLRQYADLSESSNLLQQSTSQEIIKRIKEFKADPDDVHLATANNLIDEIRSKVENMEIDRENIMTPITAVRLLAEKLFRHSGIKIGTRLSFGDAANAVNSDVLSAGEKQMLSFICYNAFYRNSIFIIDEPELSLHVDWQRQLFRILMDQTSGNQFVIATHSPFIYAKYPDKEISLDPDRGDQGNS